MNKSIEKKKEKYESVMVSTFVDKYEGIKGAMDDVNTYLSGLTSTELYTYDEFCRELISYGKDLLEEIDYENFNVYQYLNEVITRMVRDRVPEEMLERMNADAQKRKFLGELISELRSKNKKL